MWGAVTNLFASDGTLELGLRGVYAGRDKIRQALNIMGGERLDADEVNDHLQLATVVHIAPDGQTARARGVELSVSGIKGRGAQWEEGIFENEYVKQNAIWKIQSVHYYPRVTTDYELGWAKGRKAGCPTSFPVSAGSTFDGSLRNISKDVLPRVHYANPVTRLPVQYPAGIARRLRDGIRRGILRALRHCRATEEREGIHRTIDRTGAANRFEHRV
jgi:hypothetical protein